MQVCSKPMQLPRDVVVTNKIWRLTSAIEAPKLKEPPLEMGLCLPYVLQPEVTQRLGQQLSTWSRRAEDSIRIAAGQNLQQTCPQSYRRCDMPRLKIVKGPLETNKDSRFVFKEKETRWLCTLARGMHEWASVRHSPTRQARRAELYKLIGDTRAKPPAAQVLERHVSTSISEALDLTKLWQTFSQEDIEAAVKKLDKLVEKAIARERSKSKIEMCKWIEADARAGLGGAHRLVKAQYIDESPVQVVDGIWCQGNTAVAMAATRGWASVWVQKHYTGKELQQLAVLVDLAKKAGPAFAPDSYELSAALKQMKKSSAVSLDGWSIRHLAILPAEALDDLGKQMYTWQANAALPIQALCQSGVLLQKPSGGNRVIMLLFMLLRFFTKAALPHLNAWGEKVQGPWDDAVRGVGALAAGLDRMARDEIAIGLGEQTAAILWDLQKFFDSIDLFGMVDIALRMDYHPAFLALVVQQYMAIRSLRVKNACGRWVVPTRSITAGCGRACLLIKAIMYPVLEACSNVGTLVRSSQYLDDVTQVARGSGKNIIHTLPVVGMRFLEGIHNANLLESDTKSCIVASNSHLANCVARGLQNLTGKRLPIVGSGKDVGLDYTAGKKRTFVVSKGRAALAKKKVGFAKSLAIRLKIRRKLYFSGARPQADYHTMVLGMNPRERAVSRGLAHQAICSGQAAGRSATIDIALSLGKSKEPLLISTIAMVREWLKWWKRSPDQHIRAAKVWSATKHNLQKLETSAKRWRAVTGPTSALIATLLDLGWNPVGPNFWRDRSGETWRAKGKNFDQLHKRLEEDVHVYLCKGSSIPWFEGGQDGVDLWSLQKRLTNFENKGRAGDAGVLRSIAAGGTLTLQRRFPDLEPQHPLKLCRQCGTEAETALHRFWTCPCIPELYGHSSEVGTVATDEEKLEVETYEATIEKTQSLKQDAIVGCTTRDQQCFYLRGLLPQGWTTCSEPHQVVEKRFGQALEAEPACVEHIFVDGSGSTSDPRLRRCGWAVAWIDFGPCSGDTYPEAKVLGAMQGNMDMDSQSVPAAELTALLQALRATKGDITIWSDCWFVVQGFAHAR